MEEKTHIDRVTFLEEQVNCYMQKLRVNNPYQVLIYFEKQVNKYTVMLKQEKALPPSVVTSLQHLVEEYSLFILFVKEYIKTKGENYLSRDAMAK